MLTLSALLTAAVLAQGDFAWPVAVSYDGEVRDAAWLEAAYQRLAGRIVLADGRFYHLDEPTRAARPAGSAWADHCLAKAARDAEGTSVLCDLDTGGQAVAQLPLKLDVKKDSLLLLTHHASRITGGPQWSAFPAEPRPITRSQFVEAIRAGLQLWFTHECSRCKGKGKTPPLVIERGRPARWIECSECKGKGIVPIRSIAR